MSQEPHPMLHRRGRFMIDQHLVLLDPESARLILAECVVVRCELSHIRRAFMYEAISHHFGDLGDNLEPLDYCPQLLRVNVGTEGEPKYETRFNGFVRIPQP